MLSCQIKEDRIQHMLTSQYRGSWGKHRGWEEDSGEQAGRVDKGGGGTAQGYINGCRITAIWRSWWEPQGCWWSHVTESIACCTWESAPAKLPASGRQVVQCLLVSAPRKPGIGKKSWEYSETCYLHKTMLCLRLQLWEVEDSSRTLRRWRSCSTDLYRSVQAGMVAPQTEHPLMVGTMSVKKLGFMTTFCWAVKFSCLKFSERYLLFICLFKASRNRGIFPERWLNLYGLGYCIF